MRIELAKIAKANPNAVPLYIILNSAKKEAPAEQPLYTSHHPALSAARIPSCETFS